MEGKVDFRSGSYRCRGPIGSRIAFDSVSDQPKVAESALCNHGHGSGHFRDVQGESPARFEVYGHRSERSSSWGRRSRPIRRDW